MVAFGQTTGPLLVLAQWGGVPLLSFAVALLGTSLWAVLENIAGRLRTRPGHDPRLRGPLPIAVPAVTICAVLLATAAATPGVRRGAASVSH